VVVVVVVVVVPGSRSREAAQNMGPVMERWPPLVVAQRQLQGYGCHSRCWHCGSHSTCKKLSQPH